MAGEEKVSVWILVTQRSRLHVVRNATNAKYHLKLACGEKNTNNLSFVFIKILNAQFVLTVHNWKKKDSLI